MISALLLAAATYVPVFKGYEADRYQQHDKLILRLVKEYNADKATWAGATDAQGRRMHTLDPAVVKAHMIEETGGNDPVSRAAWAVDPLQVNVPGDWNHYKRYLGLRKPRHRNEGTRETNLRAGIAYLARKGFGIAGQPAGNRPEGSFDGWHDALKRYNGRTVKTASGKVYCEVYADKIEKRAAAPEEHVPVQIDLKK